MAAERDYELAAAVYPDPRKLLYKDEWYYDSPFIPFKGPLCGLSVGVLGRFGNLFLTNRPYLSGIHLTIAIGTVGAIVGSVLQYGVKQYFGYRDRVYKHYIITHLDDFPPPPKVKIGDVWEPWIPIR